MNFAQRPGDHECFEYQRDYVASVPDGDIFETLTAQLDSVEKTIRSIPDDQFETVHAPYAWKVRTVLEHCCDAERVFGYRALRFAVGDNLELPGWDQDTFADANHSAPKSADELLEEFTLLRKANLSLLKRLNPAVFDFIGLADGRKASVRTLAWLMAGHWIHHETILKKRLGITV